MHLAAAGCLFGGGVDQRAVLFAFAENGCPPAEDAAVEVDCCFRRLPSLGLREPPHKAPQRLVWL